MKHAEMETIVAQIERGDLESIEPSDAAELLDAADYLGLSDKVIDVLDNAARDYESDDIGAYKRTL